MASRLPFYFVDVFATRPLTGNPLSLVPQRVRVGGSGLVVAEGTLIV